MSWRSRRDAVLGKTARSVGDRPVCDPVALVVQQLSVNAASVESLFTYPIEMWLSLVEQFGIDLGGVQLNSMQHAALTTAGLI